MTIDSGDSTPSSNQRRTVARDKAKQLREEQKKKDRRNKVILQGSLILVVLAIVLVVFVVITSTIKPPAPGPRNMLSDGVKISEGFDALRTRALQPSSEPVPSASNEPSSILDIRIYADYMCPVCGAFEKANAEQIKKLVDDGVATVEIHPVAILDRLSKGTKFSTRATNATACVANFSPDNVFGFNALLFANQPEENTPGLTDEEIIELAKEAGVVSTFKQVSKCVEEKTFKSWVAAATDRFVVNPIPNVAVQPPQHSTPMIYVNGQLYEYTVDLKTGEFDAKEFTGFLTKMLGADFTETSVASPSPSPSPEP